MGLKDEITKLEHYMEAEYQKCERLLELPETKGDDYRRGRYEGQQSVYATLIAMVKTMAYR